MKPNGYICVTLDKVQAMLARMHNFADGPHSLNPWKLICEAMTEIADVELALTFKPDQDGERFSSHLLFTTKSASKANFQAASGGHIELLAVLTTIFVGLEAGTILLDEPGFSLHPPHQARLARWLSAWWVPVPGRWRSHTVY